MSERERTCEELVREVRELGKRVDALERAVAIRGRPAAPVCTDCKHHALFFYSQGLPLEGCLHPAAERETKLLSLGRAVAVTLCENIRAEAGPCGPAGKLFESKRV